MTKFVNIITFARASLVASASAAMALCKFWGSLTSFTWIKKSKPVQLKYFTLAVTDQCHLHSFNVNTPWVCGSIDHGLKRRRSTYILQTILYLLLAPTFSPPAIASLSDSSSASVLVPKMFLNIWILTPRTFLQLPEGGRGKEFCWLWVIRNIADSSHWIPGGLN